MARLEHVKTQKAERCSGFLGSATAGRECTVLQLGCRSFARGCDLGGSELIRGTSLSSWLRRSHPSASVAVKTELLHALESSAALVFGRGVDAESSVFQHEAKK